MTIDARLASLGITLPQTAATFGAYVPAVASGSLLFVSGQLPARDGKVAYVGKVGKDLTLEQGQEAAKLALVNALAVVKAQLYTLDRVTRIVRMAGYVNSAPGFTDQPRVLNAASELLVQVFGEHGRHARLALGASELPLNAAVELELIVEFTRH